jgi:Transposase DDE domain
MRIRGSCQVAGGGFEQCYNAQAVVATESLLVIATDVVQTPNDKQQIAPMLEKIDALPERFGQVETLLADNGYFSEANVMVCVAANIDADCGRTAAASSLLARTICRRAAGAGKPDTGRDDGLASADTAKAKSATACASRPRNRCSASSNR